jgi:methionyl-tRNA synthetase
MSAALTQWAHDFARECFRQRLQRAGADDCAVCGARRHPDAHISDPCERCGAVEEHHADVEREQRVLAAYQPTGPEPAEDDFPF